MSEAKFVGHRVTLPMLATRAMGNGTPMLIMLNAFLKSIKPITDDARKVKLTFRVPNAYAHRLRKQAHEAFTLEVVFSVRM